MSSWTSELGRRRLLSLLSRGAGGAVLGAGLLATPAAAETALDVRILQTASSLEALAVAFYGSVPEGAGARGAGATLAAFARDASRQHVEHRRAFQARTTALGGRVQDAPNPKFLPMVAAADLSTPAKLVDVAATIEKVATDTYLLDLSMLADGPSKAIVAGVMAVGAQRLATLRTVSALLAAGAEPLVTFALLTSDLATVPAPVGSVAFPDALHQVGGPELVAEPASGALA